MSTATMANPADALAPPDGTLRTGRHDFPAADRVVDGGRKEAV